MTIFPSINIQAQIHGHPIHGQPIQGHLNDNPKSSIPFQDKTLTPMNEHWPSLLEATKNELDGEFKKENPIYDQDKWFEFLFQRAKGRLSGLFEFKDLDFEAITSLDSLKVYFLKSRGLSHETLITQLPLFLRSWRS